MIKRINKQIIEIKCTNDEYFEKALLFVRAEKCSEPYELIERCARDYCGSIQTAKGSGRRKKTAALLLVTGLVLISAAVLLILLAV